MRAMSLDHNDQMNMRRGVRQDSKLRKAVRFGAVTTALSITLAACSSSSPSAQSPKLSGTATIRVSGQITAHYTKHCAIGSDATPNQVTVAFPDVTKVSDTPLALVVYVPESSASITYPSSSMAATVRLATTTAPNYSWGGRTLSASGTLTISGGGKTGSLNLTLAPTPLSASNPTNQATGNVHVQGAWTGCRV